MQLKESIQLDIDDTNELLFKVQVEGSDVAPARVRLVCEGDEVSYVFSGHGTEEPGVVQFLIPNMTNRLKEGTYQSTVEVLIDNRYFAPVQFEIDFKQPVKVTAESITRPTVRRRDDITVVAAPVIVEKRNVEEKKQELKPIKVEERKPRQSLLAKRHIERLRSRGDVSVSDADIHTIIEDFAKEVIGGSK